MADLKNFDFKETVVTAQKAIGSKPDKKKSVIPVELRLFLKGVPKPIIAVVIFLVIEALVGIGFTIYYLWFQILIVISAIILFFIGKLIGAIIYNTIIKNK